MHKITIDTSRNDNKTARGTRVFIDDKEIHGIESITANYSANAPKTVTITMQYSELVTNTQVNNEVDDGK